jgi:hypothetical protein
MYGAYEEMLKERTLSTNAVFGFFQYKIDI